MTEYLVNKRGICKDKCPGQLPTSEKQTHQIREVFIQSPNNSSPLELSIVTTMLRILHKRLHFKLNKLQTISEEDTGHILPYIHLCNIIWFASRYWHCRTRRSPGIISCRFLYPTIQSSCQTPFGPWT